MTKNTTLIINNEIECKFLNLSDVDREKIHTKWKIHTANYFFNPKYKLGIWDGTISFFSKKGDTSVNLLDEIIPDIIKLGYKINIVDHRQKVYQDPEPIDENYFSHIIHPKTQKPIILRYYQVEAVNIAIKERSGIILAGTGSGKTLMTVAVANRYGELGYRSLIVVPDKTLIRQTHEWFVIMGVDTGMLGDGEKDLNHQHLVSTWHSLENNKQIIPDYHVIIVDECHQSKANILNNIIGDSARNIVFRFGFSGTLPKEKCDVVSIKKVLGTILYRVPTHKLIKEEVLAKTNISIYQIETNLEDEYEKYKQNASTNIISYTRFKNEYFPDYSSETSFLRKQKERITAIGTIIEELRSNHKGNTLCLVSSIEFGTKLKKEIKDAYFVYGKDQTKERKKIYDLFETNNNIVVIATVHIAGTGLDISRIFNLVFVDIGKSFVRVVQTLGRSVRTAEDKDSVEIYDICSDLKYSRKHLSKRIEYYKEEKHPYKKYVIKI